MDSYGKIAVDFVKDRFGNSIGPSLLRAEYKIHNINDINQLDTESQVHFMGKFLKKRFSKFLRPEEVEAKILQLNTYYAIIEALERISSQLRQKITIKSFDIRMNAELSTISKIKDLAVGSIIISNHISNSIEADLFYSIKREKSTEITRVVYHSENKSYEYGKVSERALTKFLNLLTSETIASLNNLIKKDILLRMTSEKMEGNIMENFLSKFQEGIFYEPSSFFSELPLMIDKEEIMLNVMIVFRKNGAAARI